MDTNQLRAHIEGALEARRALEEADANVRAAKEVRERAYERHNREVGALDALLDGGVAIYGDNIIKIGAAPNGPVNPTVVSSPVARVPVALPPTPAITVSALPEASAAITSQPPAQPPPIQSPVSPRPLSGGVIPPSVTGAGAAKKQGGK